MSYQIVERPFDGLVLISGSNGFKHAVTRQMWSRIQARKVTRCENCELRIEKREKVYRPITNAKNRMDRLCLKCVEKNS